MLESTLEIVKSALRADSTIAPQERTRAIALLRNGGTPEREALPDAPEIIKPAEAARRLSRSVRGIHLLCEQGLLSKAMLPGRMRACGITAVSLNNLLASAIPQTPAKPTAQRRNGKAAKKGTP